MNDPNPDKPKIIVDEDWKSQVSAEKEAYTAAGNEAKQDDQETRIPDASFPMLVTTLATQATVALGQMAAPDAPEVMVDLALAKHLIDTLDVLEAKTQGNLTADESNMLTNILHQLRMLYVAVQSSVKEKPAPGEDGSSSIELP